MKTMFKKSKKKESDRNKRLKKKESEQSKRLKRKN